MDNSICQGCARQGLCGGNFKVYCTGYIRETPIEYSSTIIERVEKMFRDKEAILQAGKEDEE